jgi:hypothetical protein
MEMEEVERAIAMAQEEPGSEPGLVFHCQMCKRQLGRFEEEHGLAVCYPCRQYYYPEKGPALEVVQTKAGPILAPLNGPTYKMEPGPLALDNSGQAWPRAGGRRPKRLGVLETPPLWIPEDHCLHFC